MALKAGFLIGGDTNETPQTLARKRALIAQIMANGRAPTSIGEGLSALGDGIVANVLERRASAAEKAGQASANEAFAPIAAMFTGGMGGAPSQSASQAPVSGSQAQNGGMGTYRDAIASIESAGSGDYAAVGPTHPKLGRALGRYQIMEANIGPWSQEVLGRTVTPDEFMANPQLQDQIFDGKFQGYVSKYGPEGAAQAWFGGPGGVGKTDRKDSLGTTIGAYGQKFINALGGTAADAVTAMGQGGQTPSQASAYVEPMGPASTSAPQQGPSPNGLPFDLVSGSPQLARADTRQGILRALTGQAGASPGATGAFPAAPVSSPMAAQQAATAPSMAAPAPMQAPIAPSLPQISTQQLIAAINNPWLNDSQRAIAQSMLDQQLQANDPMRQLEMQKMQIELKQMQNPQQVRVLTAEEKKTLGLPPNGAFQMKPDGTIDQIGGGGVNITNEGTIPAGYRAVRDAEGRVMAIEPLPGSPAAAEAATAADKKDKAKTVKETAANVVMQDIDRAFTAMDDATLPTTGFFGNLLSGVGGTAARDIAGLTQTVKANASFDKLQQMRDASPTGGALGSVTDTELGLLSAAIGNLEQSQSEPQFRDNLARVYNIYADITHGEGKGPARKPLSFETNASKPVDTPPPAGMDKEIWDVMTPEERALWK